MPINILNSNGNSLSVLLSPYSFGNQISINFSGSDDPNQRISLYDTEFRFLVSMQNYDPTIAYTIRKAVYCWFLSFDITVMYSDGRPTQQISSYVNRGQVANLLQRFNQSYSKTTMLQQFDLMTNGTSSTEQRFEVNVPMKYLFDAFAMSKSWLPIKNIKINLALDSVEQIFRFDPATSPNGSANITNIFMDFNVDKLQIEQPLSIQDHMMLNPGLDRIYVINQTVLTSQSQVSCTVTPPGQIHTLFYLFVQNDKTGFNFHANPDAYVMNHSLQSGNGKIYPVQSQYTGTQRHYADLLRNIQKLSNPNADTTVTRDDFLNTTRVYSICCRDEYMSTPSSYSFNTQLSAPFPVNCQMLLFCLYYLPKQTQNGAGMYAGSGMYA